ncbi:MAG: hypothetical protein AAF990_00325 [Bacteroidota bacterium]
MRTCLLLLCSFVFFQLPASDLVLRTRVASALGKVTLYPDSTYFKPSNTVFDEGTLFKILGETTLEHEDDAQNQKFKWYRAEAPNGKQGWIFGDELAVVVSNKRVPASLRPYHKHRFAFNNGFEQSIAWVGALEGRDNFHKQDLLNPIYNQFYLIITNEQGRSVHIQYASQSARGEDQLRHFQLYDISGDDIPELILQTSNFPTGSRLENRSLSIFAFQAGTLANILNERMTLTYKPGVASPALFKSIEIDNDMVRVEFIDYVNCKQYKLPHRYDGRGQDSERCLEYVTYTYLWDERRSTLVPFYKESRSTPFGRATRQGISLWNNPSVNGRRLASLSPEQQLQIIKHIEKSSPGQRATNESTHFLYVKTPDGRSGYVLAELLRFVQTDHASLLEAYYKQEKPSKSDWQSDKSFLKIVSKGSSSAANER